MAYTFFGAARLSHPTLGACSPSRVATRTGHGPRPSAYPFVLRGFLVFLTYMPHLLPSLPTAGQLPLRSHVRPIKPRYAALLSDTVPLATLWGQWLAFFSVFTYLVDARVTFSVVGHPDLAILGRALSWTTWRSSFWGWRLFLAGDPSSWVRGPSCIVLFSSRASLQARHVTRLATQRACPVLGVGAFDVCWDAWAHIFSSNTHKTFQVFFLQLISVGLTAALLNADDATFFNAFLPPLSRVLFRPFLGLRGVTCCYRAGVGCANSFVRGVGALLSGRHVLFLGLHALYFFSCGGHLGLFSLFTV